ncbi:hypothetical protein [Aphanothece sacrum]|uniref:Bacterial regulatory s, luxR family protein n=1 Tax=Aphanothece sacrum FPU1 TaxID=1920663 RepID=A0A401IGT6_APHSA|nr:hypothetical protein [Aphanothece sacrum]GBF80410.1 bacterial regulatory s, luxR family protein [Aphanothece sacrum FPU1]GBF84883.1 bacterial regulatory s, luxR family protein [Aphanothece sacrum FPU3]
MSKTTQDLYKIWYKRLREELPEQVDEKRRGILQWLLNGEISSDEQLEYRYRILRQRYLTVDSRQGYRLLITRLACLMISLSSVRTWMEHSGLSDQDLLRLLQKVIQKLVDQDPHWQKQVKQMAKLTQDGHLRQAFVLASLELYSLHSVNGQPWLFYLLRQSFRHQLETPIVQHNREYASSELIKLTTSL